MKLRPRFLDTRRIGVFVATSGYCNARCADCIWPFMRNDQRVMSRLDFTKVLHALKGYEIDEFGFNIINEPFVDKGISEKIILLAESGLKVDVLFFSSNWLIPNAATLDGFLEAVVKAKQSGTIGRIDINATISGIDQKSYDELQAGRNLEDAVMQYRPLDFQKAVTNIIEVIRRLQDNGALDGGVIFRLKSYGQLFDCDAYAEFWGKRLTESGITRETQERSIDILWNHGYTTFARMDDNESVCKKGVCTTGWLDTRIALGPGGEVGLCCEDGLRSVTIGNLLSQTLDQLSESPAYQERLATNLGLTAPVSDSPCRNCQQFKKAADNLDNAKS